MFHLQYQEEIGQQEQFTIIIDMITEIELQVQQLLSRRIVVLLIYLTQLSMS